MTRYLKNSVLTLATLLLATIMVSCVSKDSQFGNTMIPPSWDMSTRLDSTIKVRTYTYAVDSVMSSSSTSTSRLVGSFIDPLTGRTSTQLFTNYQPFGLVLTSGTYFGKDPVADSIFLSLSITGYRGDTTVATNFEVSEVLRGDYPYWKPFYSNYDISKNIAETPLYKFTQKSPQSLKVKLPIEFANKLMVNTQDKSNPYHVDSVFKQTFKGIYIKSDITTVGEGCIYSIDLASSGITMHYHNSNAEKRDTTTVTYLFHDETYAPLNTNFLMAQHDYSFADPSKGGVKVSQINDSTIQTELNYIQGVGGLGMALVIPQEEIERINEKVKAAGYGKIGIHSAEIKFTVEGQNWENYDKMFSKIAPYFSLSPFAFTPDYQPLMQGFPTTIGGTLNRSLGTYTLNITSYVQGLLLGRITNHTQQIAAELSQYLVTNRSVIRGSASDTPPVLVLTYTMLK